MKPDTRRMEDIRWYEYQDTFLDERFPGWRERKAGWPPKSEPCPCGWCNK